MSKSYNQKAYRKYIVLAKKSFHFITYITSSIIKTFITRDHIIALQASDLVSRCCIFEHKSSTKQIKEMKCLGWHWGEQSIHWG